MAHLGANIFLDCGKEYKALQLLYHDKDQASNSSNGAINGAMGPAVSQNDPNYIT